jgi:DNA-directed RNA polymerase alpha subunit
MNPKLSNVSDEADVLRFTLHGLDVSFANAIRRTILSDIPTVVIETDTYENNKCDIHINTGRLHNEILKQRLSCIPIHTKKLRDDDDGKALPGNYALELDLKNDGENMLFVTSGDFMLRDKSTNTLLTKPEMNTLFPDLFPMNSITRSYIDFARLRPKMGEGIHGEHLKLSADFTISTAKTNSMYNVVSKCAYGNTPDATKASQVWDAHENKLRAEGETAEDIKFQKENFRLLDAQRQFVPNSFDFVVQSVCAYANRELVRKSCVVLQNKFIDFIQAIDSGMIPIFISETTMAHCYDVLLEGEDYTMGKVIEHILYEKHYMGDKTLSFCGFKKFHPHNTDATIRVAFNTNTDKPILNQYLRETCVEAQQLFKDVYSMFM